MRILFFALSICLAVGFSFFAALAGIAAQKLTGFFANRELPLSIRASLGYFAGAGLFLGIWKLTDAGLKNARLSVVLTMAILALLIWKERESVHRFIREALAVPRKGWLVACWSAVAVWIVVFLYWLSAVNVLNPHSNVGSQAAAKYGGMALYMVEHNYVLVVGQHLGQSMFSAAASMILLYPLVHLHCFLAISIFNLCWLFAGLLSWLGVPERSTGVLTFLLLFGNTALSLVHVWVVDSGSPPFITGNTDTVFGFATLVGYCLWLHHFLERQQWTWTEAVLATLVWMASWNITGSQDIPLVFALLGLLFLWCLRNRPSWLIPVAQATAALVIGCAILLPVGGMLTPKSLVERPGIGLLQDLGDAKLNVYPGLPHFVQGLKFMETGELFQATPALNADWKKTSDALSQSRAEGLWIVRGFVLKSWFILESLIWNSVRVLFWPMAALVLHFFWLRGNYRFVKFPPGAANALGFVTLAFLIAGYVPVLLVRMGLYKWEMTRLLIPAFLFGAILQGCVLQEFVMRNFGEEGRWRRALVVATALLTAGPVSTIFLKICINIIFSLNSHQPKTLDLYFIRQYVFYSSDPTNSAIEGGRGQD